MPEALVYAEPLTTCEHFQTSNHVRCARLTSSRMCGHIYFDRHVRSCLELPRTNPWEHSDIYFQQKCVITYREAQATGQSIHGVAGEREKPQRGIQQWPSHKRQLLWSAAFTSNYHHWQLTVLWLSTAHVTAPSTTAAAVSKANLWQKGDNVSSGGQSKTPLQRVTSGPCAAFFYKSKTPK